MKNRQTRGMFSFSTTLTTRERRTLVGIILIAIGLVLLIVFAGIFVVYQYMASTQPSSRSSTTATNTKLLSMSAADLYHYVISQPPSLVDTLDGSHASAWNIYQQGDSACQFREKALHIVVSPTESSAFCFLRNEFLQNFGFQVQVQFASDINLNTGTFDEVGIVFRTHLVQQTTYEFSLSTGMQGNQSSNNAALTVLNEGGNPNQLGSWSNGIPSTFTTSNTLTVIALQNKINLYINAQPLATVSDATFQAGQIGLVSSSTFSPPAPSSSFDTAFRNAHLWLL